jgi:hypothetical protein
VARFVLGIGVFESQTFHKITEKNTLGFLCCTSIMLLQPVMIGRKMDGFCFLMLKGLATWQGMSKQVSLVGIAFACSESFTSTPKRIKDQSNA